MMDTNARRELVVGIDPARNRHLALAWAADEAHRRRLDLRLVVAVPPGREWREGDDRPRRKAMLEAGADALREGAGWVRARHPQMQPVTELLDGFPATVIGGLSARARMVVLGSRHLSRTAEYFSAGSLVVPVTAQARCPVVVVGDAEHITQQPLTWWWESTAASPRKQRWGWRSRRPTSERQRSVPFRSGSRPYSCSTTRRTPSRRSDACSPRPRRAGQRGTRGCM